jgi:hypothetical protein
VIIAEQLERWNRLPAGLIWALARAGTDQNTWRASA